MLRILLFILLQNLVVLAFAQNSDCGTAISVCDEVYVEDDSPSGTGQVFELAPGSCQTSGEFNSAWYVFTVQENGVLNFVLEPNDLFDDYDWSLFNITDNGCGGINNGQSPEVSCNSYGVLGGIQGETGISSAEGGNGSSNGPGDLNGPPFNADINVTAGQVFALVIMNYSSTLNGYTLDFSPSTASIFDDEAPTIVSVTQNCDANELTVIFSENVVTDNLNLDLFSLSNGQDVLTPTDVQASNTNFDNTVVLEFATPFETGTYTLSGGNDGSLADFCGTPWQDDFVVDLFEPIVFNEPVYSDACNGSNGGVNFPDAAGGATPLNILFNNVGYPDLNITNVNAGPFTLLVTDANGCSESFSGNIPTVVASVELGSDVYLCQLSTTLTADFQGDQIQWSTPSALQILNPGQGTSTFNAFQTGVYDVYAEVTTGDCYAIDDVSLFLTSPPNVLLSVTDETCNGYCDGAVEVVNINPEVMIASLDGLLLSGDSVVFENLCSGDRSLTIQFSPQCTADYPISIDAPAQVQASFTADPWVTTILNTEIQFVNTSANADSIYWVFTHDPTIEGSSDEWSTVLPQDIGTYEVTLTAFGENDCADVFRGYITVLDEFRFFIPNAFTPDNDGINDYFIPRFSYAPEYYELMIFNRWGEKVFESFQYDQPWTGNVEGGDHYAKSDVFNWILKTKGLEVDVKTYQGSVTLVR